MAFQLRPYQQESVSAGLDYFKSKTNKNAALLTENLLEITTEINKGKGTVGLLINDIEVANDLKETIHYLKISGTHLSNHYRQQ